MSTPVQDEELLAKLFPYILATLLVILGSSFVWNLWFR